MNGKMLSGGHIKRLTESGIIKIDPYDAKCVRSAWYALHPDSVYFDIETNPSIPEPCIHREYLSERNGHYDVQPHDYVVIGVKERIKLPIGIVGLFVQASNVIEKGVLLTVGKLDSEYDSELKFGLYNTRAHPVTIFSSEPMVYITLFDLRENSGEFSPLFSDYEQSIRSKRK